MSGTGDLKIRRGK